MKNEVDELINKANEDFHPIQKRGDKYVLLGKKGQVLGTHDSYDDALQQLKAVQRSMHHEAQYNEAELFTATENTFNKLIEQICYSLKRVKLSKSAALGDYSDALQNLEEAAVFIQRKDDKNAARKIDYVIQNINDAIKKS